MALTPSLKRVVLSIATVSILILSGCGSATTPSQSASPTQTQTPEPPEPVYVAAPLTGVQYLEGSNAALSNPAFAAKIDNVGTALPQYGLNATDIVFVEQVEGGLTRLVAVWHSNLPAEVGPVRSVRPMDPDILAPIGGIVAYSGGQAPFKQAMVATGMYNADEDSEYESGNYFRKEGRFAPHDLFFKAQAIVAAHPELAAPSQQFEYADVTSSTLPSAQEFGKEITSLKVKYLNATSLWNPGSATVNGVISEVWLRTQDGTAHTDEWDGNQVRATNLLVLDTTIDRSFKDPKYGSIPRTVMVTEASTGTLCYATHCMPIKWSKASQTAPIVLTTTTGLPVKLAPGNTWVELRDVASAKLEIEYVPEPTESPTPSASETD